MNIIASFKKIKELSLNNYYNTNNIRYIKHFAFLFLFYNIIN